MGNCINIFSSKQENITLKSLSLQNNSQLYNSGTTINSNIENDTMTINEKAKLIFTTSQTIDNDIQYAILIELDLLCCGDITSTKMIQGMIKKKFYKKLEKKNQIIICDIIKSFDRISSSDTSNCNNNTTNDTDSTDYKKEYSDLQYFIYETKYKYERYEIENYINGKKKMKFQINLESNQLYPELLNKTILFETLVKRKSFKLDRSFF